MNDHDKLMIQTALIRAYEKRIGRLLAEKQKRDQFWDKMMQAFFATVVLICFGGVAYRIVVWLVR